MEVAVNKTTVEFSGLLNEDSSPQIIQNALEAALQNSSTQTAYLDFSRVKRANSCGILAWYKVLNSLKGNFIYIKSPRWLVEQFNMSDFFTDNVTVHSIEANFYCSKNNSHENIILILGEHIPILEDYNDFTFSIKSKNGFNLEMDFEPNEYFYFISSRYEKFKRRSTT